MRPDGVAPRGSEPHDPGMEARVARPEEDTRNVKATLGRLEPVLVRIDAQLQATLPRLTTKAELADLRSEVESELADFRTEVRTSLAAVSSRTCLAALAVLR